MVLLIAKNFQIVKFSQVDFGLKKSADADGSIVLCCEPDQNSIRTFIVARSARLMVSTDMMSTGTLNA